MIPSAIIFNGDALGVLRTMPSDSVHCVITSPPYWGLRDYGVEGQLGLERSPAEYLDKIVLIFREVRRVLRRDGSLWLNMGDTSVTNPHGSGPTHDPKWPAGRDRSNERPSNRLRFSEFALKPKDLVGMPWRVALALQADGWWLRQDVIWEKPTAMPESAKDRVTRSHEYIFHMTKSEEYFHDWFSILEPASPNSHARSSDGLYQKVRIGGNSRVNVSRDPRHASETKSNPSFLGAVRNVATVRNKRSVWKVASQPYKGAHFATFPKKLIEPCVLAGTSEHGCCYLCGAPYVRIVDKPFYGDWHPNPELKKAGVNRNGNTVKWNEVASKQARNGDNFHRGAVAPGKPHKVHPEYQPPKHVGWKKSCHCTLTDARVPCTILDPFTGAGTTALVAHQHGRSFMGIEISEEYCALAGERILKHANRAIVRVA